MKVLRQQNSTVHLEFICPFKFEILKIISLQLGHCNGWCTSQGLPALGREWRTESRRPGAVRPPIAAQGFGHPFSPEERAWFFFFQFPYISPGQDNIRLLLCVEPPSNNSRVTLQASSSSDGNHKKGLLSTFVCPRKDKSTTSLFTTFPD